MSFTHQERVRFGDLDAMRHLNNVVYLRYFESARIAWLRDLVPEHDPTQPEGDATAVIFASCHIDYRSPVLYDELVEITLSVGEVRTSSFRLDFTMSVGERLAAEGYGWLVGFDYVEQRAAPLTGDMRARLANH